MALILNYALIVSACLFVFDQAIFPLLCLLLEQFISMISGNLLLSAGISMTVFWLENLLLGALGVICYKIKCFFMMKIKRERIIQIRSNENEQKMNEKYRRQYSVSTMVNRYPVNQCTVKEFVNYRVDWELFRVSFEFARDQKDEYQMSGEAFLNLASLTHSQISEKESMDRNRRNLAKSGYIDWDRLKLVQNDLLENTGRVLDHFKKHTDERRTAQVQTNAHMNVYKQGDLVLKTKRSLHEKIALVILAVSVFYSWSYITYYIYCVGHNLIVSFLEFLTICHLVMSAFRHFIFVLFATPYTYVSTYLFGTVAFMGQGVWHQKQSPIIGAFGYRVTDEFARGMARNIVDPLKNLQVNVPIQAIAVAGNSIMTAFHPFSFNVSAPMVDRSELLTSLAGLYHRGAGLTPLPLPSWLNRKKEIGTEVFDAHFAPLMAADYFTVEETLNKTNYTEKVKDEYRKIDLEHPEMDLTTPRMMAPFGKEEPYPKCKQQRTIQALARETKEENVFRHFATFVSTVSSFAYQLPCGVKGCDTAGIVEKIMSLGPGSKTISDYSSYEASFSRAVQDSAQFLLYDLFDQLQEGVNSEYAKKLVGGVNKMRNHNFMAQIKNMKCSGDFDTALSNFYDNAMSFATVFDIVYDIPWQTSMEWYLCEGDDNITDDHGFCLDAEMFKNLGLTAKVEQNLTSSEAGFCQKYITDTGELVADPLRYLSKWNILPTQYAMANTEKQLQILAAKCMSTLAEFPNAPVVSELAYATLERLKDVVVSEKAMKQAMKYGQNANDLLQRRFVKPIISIEARLLISELFEFSMDKQEQFTSMLQNWETGPLPVPREWFSDEWVEFYDTYSTEVPKLASALGEQCVDIRDDVIEYLRQNLIGESCENCLEIAN